MKNMLRTLVAAWAMLLLAGVATAETITIATVSNGDMIRMQELAVEFTAENPDIELEWVTLEEGILRQRVTTDIATNSGRFDIVTIGSYEAPIWAMRGWLLPLSDMPKEYDVDDLIPSIKESLSYKGVLYAAPFYGESSFTMYRTDLIEAVGLAMPDEPTWDFIRKAAAAIAEKNPEVHGICLRGKPGWGENVALITAMANSYGARWFDEEWHPQFDSAAWSGAINDYVKLLQDFGQPDPTSTGYTEALALFQAGKCGIWIDATVAASAVSDPQTSRVADHVGFAKAPDRGLGKRSNWLWTWALGVSAASEHQEAAKTFVAWATSKKYAQRVAERDGWLNVPPGTRVSLYNNPEYLQVAPFAQMVLAAIETANPGDPTVDKVPYTGIQYVAIPEFPAMATAVGERFAKSLEGEISTAEALENAQWVTEKVIERARFILDD
ncbi:ABC transporter substrate-binding protein [Marinobacter sp.]|uniref:ABC transporter substrate-binding protein n=1 Tax=Marinobacter sp. TaxID=50741 RepID=UPI003A942D42